MESQKNINFEKEHPNADSNKKLNAQDKKGILLVAVLAVIAIILFVNGFFPEDKKTETESTVPDVSVSESTTAESTTIPTTVQPIQTPTEPDKENNTTTTESTTENAETAKLEILRKVTEGVNSIKSDTATYTAVRSQTITLDLEECSLPAFVGVVNKVMDFFEGETITEYSFVNGKGVDAKTGDEITANGSIPPSNNLFRLTEEGLADATMEKDGENTVYTVVVVPENSTMNNPRPPHHNSAGDTFDVRNVELPIGAITKADFDYPGASISITVTPEGKVIRYQQILKIDGVGEGTAMGMTASGKIVGSIDEIWNITY